MHKKTISTQRKPCDVCNNKSVSPGDGITLQLCHHYLCKPCARKPINGEFMVKCPRQLCKGHFLLRELKEVLPQDEYLFYMQASGRMGTNRGNPTSRSTTNDPPKPFTPSSVKINSGADSSNSSLASEERAAVMYDIVQEACKAVTVSPGKTSNIIPDDDKKKSVETFSSCQKPTKSIPNCQHPDRLNKPLTQTKVVIQPESVMSVQVVSGNSRPVLQEQLQNSQSSSRPAAPPAPIQRVLTTKRKPPKRDILFQCKSEACVGFCIPEPDAKIFICDVCTRQNCLQCQTIHEGIPCSQWRQLQAKTNGPNSKAQDNLLRKSEAFKYKAVSRTVDEIQQHIKENGDWSDFDCPICFIPVSEDGTGGSFTLKDCGHSFCRTCLETHIQQAENQEVPCPYFGDEGSCEKFLSPSEFNLLASQQVREKHTRWGWSFAEDVIAKIFRCIDKDCSGFWEISDSAPLGLYCCPLCRQENCIKCNVIHDTVSCSEYQEILRQEAERIRKEEQARRDEENRKVQEANEKVSSTEVERLIGARQFMRCPYCGFVCEKISGCAHVRCLNRACQKPFNWYN